MVVVGVQNALSVFGPILCSFRDILLLLSLLTLYI